MIGFLARAFLRPKKGKMIIREAEPKEIKHIYLIIKIGSSVSEVEPPTLEATEEAVTRGHFWVAENPIFGLQGCVGLRVHRPGLAEIHSLHALPDFRNDGLKPELAKVALETADRLNITKVLTNPNGAAELKLWAAKFPGLKVTKLQPKLQHGEEQLCQQ